MTDSLLSPVFEKFKKLFFKILKAFLVSIKNLVTIIGDPIRKNDLTNIDTCEIT
jgi:hypothetical protein